MAQHQAWSCCQHAEGQALFATRHTDTRHITAHHKAARQASNRGVQSAAPLSACCLDRLVAGPITPSTTAGHHVGRSINHVFSSSGSNAHTQLARGCSCQPYAATSHTRADTLENGGATCIPDAHASSAPRGFAGRSHQAGRPLTHAGIFDSAMQQRLRPTQTHTTQPGNSNHSQMPCCSPSAAAARQLGAWSQVNPRAVHDLHPSPTAVVNTRGGISQPVLSHTCSQHARSVQCAPVTPSHAALPIPREHAPARPMHTTAYWERCSSLFSPAPSVILGNRCTTPTESPQQTTPT
jgi:hypothetical protein